MRILVDGRRCPRERLALTPTRRRNTADGGSTTTFPLGALHLIQDLDEIKTIIFMYFKQIGILTQSHNFRFLK